MIKYCQLGQWASPRSARQTWVTVPAGSSHGDSVGVMTSCYLPRIFQNKEGSLLWRTLGRGFIFRLAFMSQLSMPLTIHQGYLLFSRCSFAAVTPILVLFCLPLRNQVVLLNHSSYPSWEKVRVFKLSLENLSKVTDCFGERHSGVCCGFYRPALCVGAFVKFCRLRYPLPRSQHSWTDAEESYWHHSLSLLPPVLKQGLQGFVRPGVVNVTWGEAFM